MVRTNPESEEQITVLCAGSADGALARPLIIYPSIGLNTPLPHDNMSKDLLFDMTTTPNGSLSCECFYIWISNYFYPSK